MAIRANKFGVKTRYSWASTLAVVAGLSASYQVSAQEEAAEPEVVEEVIVQGVRSSLQNAQDIKRDADTFVDAISAEDIGSLPDRSVLEAMQRLPGISIERFAAAEDPDHFSAEGSGAVVRGMTQTRSEFNGRDSFSANSGRGLSFQDVPPELMSGVDAYKNQTADMIEGGIGGTISLRTRKPFDSAGRKLSFNFDVTSGDIASQTTPTASGIFSDRWETDAGEFGFMINASYSNLQTSSHGIQSDLFEQRTTYPNGVWPGIASAPGYPDPVPAAPDSSDTAAVAAWQAQFPSVFVPNGSNLTMKEDDRTRKGLAMAGQWENTDETILVTAQFMRSDSQLSWTENALKYQSGYYKGDVFAPDPTADNADEQFQFDSNGVFTGGVFTQISDGWRGDGDRIPHNVVGSGWGGQEVRNFGTAFQTDTRFVNQKTLVDDFAVNVKFTPNEVWEIEGDFQHIEASTDNDDVTLMLGTHAIQDYQINGDSPSLVVYEPWRYASEAAVDAYDWAGNNNYFQDPTSYYWRAAMDHYERSEGESNAVKVDFTRHFESNGPFTSVKFGARFADRDQTVRKTAYNWGQLQAPWGPPIYERDADGNVLYNNDADGNLNPLDPRTVYGGGAGWLDVPRVTDAGLGFDGALNAVEVVDWSDFQRGGVVGIQGGDKILHPSLAYTKAYADWNSTLLAVSNEWLPANLRDDDLNGTIDTIGGNGSSFFIPDEINLVGETSTAAYVRLDFEGELADRRYTGNVGLRYVTISRDVTGSVVYPDLRPQYPLDSALFDKDAHIAFAEDMAASFSADTYVAQLIDYVETLPDARGLGDYRNFLSPEIVEFANGATERNNFKPSESHVLPSLNVKFEFSDELIGRFALGKAIALPDMEDIRGYQKMGLIGDSVTPGRMGGDATSAVPTELRIVDPLDPLLYNVGDRTPDLASTDAPNGNFPGFKGEGGNPDLKAMESIQSDVSLEWYFADVGSLTASLFYKDLSGFFVNGGESEELENPNGTTQWVVTSKTRNAGDGRILGLELAYQQTYDMLPEPWDGLGIQANYTYIDAKGSPNYNNTPDEVNYNATNAREADFGDLPLQGQSKNTYNLVLFYEKYGFSGRIAYNWRSDYLLTTRDVITKLPIYNEAAGFMDASLFYDINDIFKIGIQGVNLLDTETKTKAQVTDSGQLVGRSWFVNDRRYSLVLRADF